MPASYPRKSRELLSEDRYSNPDNDYRGPYLLSDITAPFDRPRQKYQWRGHVPPEGRSWRYSIERAEQLNAEGRIIFSSYGRPRLKRYLSEARAFESVPIPSNPLRTPDLILRPAMGALARLVAENPEYLNQLEWRDLERVLREVFESLGFQTELTRSSKDGGFDLRLEVGDSASRQVFLVEVKHWVNSNKRPSTAEIDALFDVVVKTDDVQAGVLLSSNGFTRAAVHGKTEVQQQRIRLGNQDKIVSLCQEYLQSESGIWIPSTDLAELLIQGTI